MRSRLLAAALVMPVLAVPARAEVALGQGFTVSGSAQILSDYVFRGISQTRGRPAAQASLELAQESGFYIGAFTSNVAYPDTNARQEIDFIGGYRFAVGSLRLDLGATAYTYPGYRPEPGQWGLNYGELTLRAAYDFGTVTLQGTAALQPSSFGPYGTGLFLGGRATWRTPFLGLILAGDLGYQWIGDNARYGVPDYLYYAAAVLREFGPGFVGLAGVAGTNIPRADCSDGQKVCALRFVAALAWRF